MDRKTEQGLRERLGIPLEARHVLIFAESSHWDPDWLFTADEYFDRYVHPNLDAALNELLCDPRRVYSIECTFFLQKYWDAVPERQPAIQDLVNSSRLRLTSTGVTTADTLVTSTEAILRDWLVGQEWLRANGMTPEPNLAYFPDCFGCSQSLPSLLNAAGFTRTAITRLDGMLFMGCDWPLPSQFQWEGSSAAILMKQERTLDFVWRDNNGGEVLCHWNAFTYGQGDMLASFGPVRMYLYPLAIPNRSDWNVTRRIGQYVRQLLPYSRSPYLFCPIGFDFVAPIPDLVPLLDRYNQRHYPHSGIWVVNAGLDDYLALVDCHREKLPVLDLDPNPYWTGFYTSRPSLKNLAHTAVDRLLLAESLALQLEQQGIWSEIKRELEGAWAEVVVSNHHDFITGTANDRVTEIEQHPWLQRTVEKANTIISRLDLYSSETMPSDSPAKPKAGILLQKQADLPEWKQGDGLLEVHTPCYHLELAEEAGGCIVRAWDPATSQPMLSGLSNDLISYKDSGGLWRMGHEFIGGTFQEAGRASLKPAHLQVQSLEDCLEVSFITKLDGIEITRRLWLRSDMPMIRCQVHGRAADKRTLTVRFDTGIETQNIEMDEPGGLSQRPVQRKYVPTFWPVQSFAHIHSRDAGRGIAVFLGMPGAVTYRPGGQLEIVTHRNALRETAFGFITFPGEPATGHERLDHTADYAVAFTKSGNWHKNQLLEQSRRSLGWNPVTVTLRARLDDLMASMVKVEQAGVVVLAVKPATRGDGIIIRLLAPGQAGLPVTFRTLKHQATAAWLCDARERNLRELKIYSGSIHLSMPGSIATVRVV